MTFLTRERETLERLLPGLEEELGQVPMLEREQPGNPCLASFREAGGPGLLVPAVHHGRGATPREAVRVQRAIGSRSPSLAIASTMHHFSVATLVELAEQGSGVEWMLLESIAREGTLLASGFAEGRPGQSILAPTMEAHRSNGGFVVSGSKKPCSLATSMDLLTASVAVPARGREGLELAVALIPARDERIERRPFWNAPVLAGAESDEVIVRGVEVPEELIVRTDAGPDDALDEVQVSGFLWFELLMSASYLGVASALVERVLTARKGEPGERARLAVELEAAMSAVEGGALAMEFGERGEDALARTLFIRYATQDAIARAVSSATELLGGMAFIASPEVAHLSTAARVLAFHPPSRSRMHAAVVDVLEGNPLRVG